MIVEITQGHIRLEIDDKTVTVQSEALLASFRKMDFVVYSDSVEHWDTPHSEEIIDGAMKRRILAEVVAEFHRRGMTVEIN